MFRTIAMFLSLHYIIQTRLNQTIFMAAIGHYQAVVYEGTFVIRDMIALPFICCEQDFVIRCENSNQLNAKTRKVEIVLIKA